MSHVSVKVVYDFDDIMRLIAADLERKGMKQAASNADGDRSHSVRVLGCAKYGGPELQEIALREIQVSDWIETNADATNEASR